MRVAPASLPRLHDRVSIPTIRLAVALSLLLHAAALLDWLPKLPLSPLKMDGPGRPEGSLAVRIVPRPAAPALLPAIPAPPPPAAVPPPQAARTPRAQPPPAAPRVLATERPAAAALPRPAPDPPPTAAPTPQPAPAAPPPGGDLAAYIASRRSAREPAAASPPSPESAQERDNRLAAERLGLNEQPSFGSDPTRGGGIFQLRRVSFDHAEFAFFGWNRFINRKSLQVIEVSIGSHPRIELAVVRRMIAIIREQTNADFVWSSQRLGRNVNLSARAVDNAGLEAFLMSEFFPGAAARN